MIRILTRLLILLEWYKYGAAASKNQLLSTYYFKSMENFFRYNTIDQETWWLFHFRYTFYCQSLVTSVAFAKFHPNLIMGGCYSGQICMWDNRLSKKTPINKVFLLFFFCSCTMLFCTRRNRRLYIKSFLFLTDEMELEFVYLEKLLFKRVGTRIFFFEINVTSWEYW